MIEMCLCVFVCLMCVRVCVCVCACVPACMLVCNIIVILLYLGTCTLCPWLTSMGLRVMHQTQHQSTKIYIAV